MLKRPEFAGLGIAAGAALFNGFCRGAAIVSVGRITSTPASIQVFHASIGAMLTTAVALPFLGGSDALQIETPWLFFGLVLGIALLATVSNMAGSRGLRIGTTYKVAPLLYLSPAAALVGELVFLNHTPRARHLLGLALIISPALLLTVIGARARLEVVAHSEVSIDDRDSMAESAAQFIGATEKAALVEVRVHVERSDADPLERSRELFDEDLAHASLGHGLLVSFFPNHRTVVLLGDHFLEQRLSELRLRTCIDAAQTVGDMFNNLRAELGRNLVAGDARANEVPDEVSFHGF